MRRVFLVALMCLAGCQNLTGPFAPRSPERVDDPRLPISEQEVRGRDRYAIPQESHSVGPPSGDIYPFGK
jgi:hypothetical protein